MSHGRDARGRAFQRRFSSFDQLSCSRGSVVHRGAIQLCGSVSVEVNGRQVDVAMRHGNELVLFAYLLLERGRLVTRDEAAAAIWPERGPEHESAALRTVLSRLRGALGADVLGSAEGLFLRLAEDSRVDVLDAQQLVGAARRCSDPGQALELVLRALPILEQTLLPGLDRPWIDARRRHLADLWVDATEIQAWASLELDDLTSAESAARRLVERAPLHESGYQLLMLAMSRRSNTADALQVFEALRSVLREELGTSPGAELRDLHSRLLRDGNDTPARRPVALTATELRRLTSSLASARERWEHLVRHDPAQRVFELIDRTAEVEAWLICWMPGHDSGPHDHDISSGAITVVDGELTEERLTWGVSATPVRYKRFETFDFGPTDIHRVYHSGAEPSTALHVFSPPLRGLGAYERGQQGVLLRHALGPRDEVRSLPSHQ
jgi:DNA-binding SARP family transcriptional activator